LLDWNNASRLGSTSDLFVTLNNYEVNALSDTQKQGSPVRIFLGVRMYEGWNFNSGNYLFTTDTK